MTSPREPGLAFTSPFAIPAYWTPSQALAVFELLDDLRCPIFNHYQSQLFDKIPQNRHPDIERYHNTKIENPAMYGEIPVPAYWTGEEAFAVFQLIDDLHQKICAIYHTDLQDLIAKRHHSGASATNDIADIDCDDRPF